MSQVEWNFNMDEAPRDFHEAVSLLLYYPDRKFRPVIEGFWSPDMECWSWYGARSKNEVRAKQPVAWAMMPKPPEQA